MTKTYYKIKLGNFQAEEKILWESYKCIYGYIVSNVSGVGNEKQFLYILHWSIVVKS